MDMDMVRNSNHSWTKSTSNCRRSTSLIRPGVVGDPLGRHQVLTGTSSRVHITPLCSSTIHCLTVSLHFPSTVTEGQAGALAPTVDQGGGRLCLLHRQGGGG